MDLVYGLANGPSVWTNSKGVGMLSTANVPSV
jgi:hypothetical protein